MQCSSKPREWPHDDDGDANDGNTNDGGMIGCGNYPGGWASDQGRAGLGHQCERVVVRAEAAERFADGGEAEHNQHRYGRGGEENGYCAAQQDDVGQEGDGDHDETEERGQGELLECHHQAPAGFCNELFRFQVPPVDQGPTLGERTRWHIAGGDGKDHRPLLLC